MSSVVRDKSKTNSDRVSFTLLDREYVLACTEEERQFLLEAVEMLKGKIKEIRQGGNVIGNERIAVMAALHTAYEHTCYKNEKECYTEDVDEKVQSMLRKVRAVLDSE